MSDVRAVIMDMDGVVVHGDQLIDGAQGREDVDRWPYRPTRVLDSIADLEV